MNRYRDYMNRIAAPAELADKVLAGERPRRARPALAVGALAACLAAPRLLPGPRPPRMLS